MHEKDNPGSVVVRATGAKMEHATKRYSQLKAYATCLDLKRRHVMRRCGIGSRDAGIIAALLFGEDGR